MIALRASLVLLGLVGSATAAEITRVDLALVLSIDASRSVSNARHALQRSGLAAAFESAAVIEAIGGGDRHAIAVTLVEWSGPNEQTQLVDWTILSDAASAYAFAEAILAPARIYDRFTSISGAIEFSAALLDTAVVDASRKVIDVSGDGTNNAGRSPSLARDEAVSKGVTVNGLAITGVEPNLARHYQDEVWAARARSLSSRTISRLSHGRSLPNYCARSPTIRSRLRPLSPSTRRNGTLSRRADYIAGAGSMRLRLSYPPGGRLGSDRPAGKRRYHHRDDGRSAPAPSPADNGSAAGGYPDEDRRPVRLAAHSIGRSPIAIGLPPVALLRMVGRFTRQIAVTSEARPKAEAR
jgi:hypothetical protein